MAQKSPRSLEESNYTQERKYQLNRPGGTKKPSKSHEGAQQNPRDAIGGPTTREEEAEEKRAQLAPRTALPHSWWLSQVRAWFLGPGVRHGWTLGVLLVRRKEQVLEADVSKAAEYLDILKGHIICFFFRVADFSLSNESLYESSEVN
ncbi:hypothetical protein NDU88_000694 [Pleurodeles waltl]|uniref:Uncharacterized protein n=1 Tax=Pleurodeles waltl TaxID=8319 RepID=A0AAV7TH11_PLEWA|nr:hypothetical protein NDU88_000694 [Pleurodeles waltl]